MARLEIGVMPGGDCKMVKAEASERLAEALGGKASTMRASHIVPRSKPLRVVYRAIRAVSRDDGSWAEWTRGWKCLWSVDIVGGPCWGKYQKRSDAIAAEIRWLNRHKIVPSISVAICCDLDEK